MARSLTPDLLPRAKRRNRLLLVTGLCALTPFVIQATGVFDKHRHRGPLLVAIDELPQTSPRLVDGSAIREVMLIAKTTPREFPDSPPAEYGARLESGFHALISTTTEETVNSSSESHSIEPASFVFDESMRWFNNRPVRPVRTLRMHVTAYSPDERSCGESADGITASGYSVWTNGMKLAAADTGLLPFGTMISVPGYDDGAVVPVLDRGGAIRGSRLDMLYPTHELAQRWGTQRLDVTVWEYADGLPSGFKAWFNSESAIKN